MRKGWKWKSKIEIKVKDKKYEFGRRLSTSHACSYPGVRAGWPKTCTPQILYAGTQGRIIVHGILTRYS